MSKKKYTIVLIVLSSILFSACKKETPIIEDDFFTANIENNLITFQHKRATINNKYSPKMLQIIGGDSKNIINIDIINYIGPGNYVSGSNSYQIAGAYTKRSVDVTNDKIYYIDNAQVQITSVDDGKIKGIFSFVSLDSDKTTRKYIYGGRFSMKLEILD